MLDLCAPCLVEFTLQKIQLCVKTLGTDISARQAVVLRPTVVIVDAFTDIYSDFPFFSEVPASTVVKIMDQKRGPTCKFVWQALFSDCR